MFEAVCWDVEGRRVPGRTRLRQHDRHVWVASAGAPRDPLSAADFSERPDRPDIPKPQTAFSKLQDDLQRLREARHRVIADYPAEYRTDPRHILPDYNVLTASKLEDLRKNALVELDVDWMRIGAHGVEKICQTLHDSPSASTLTSLSLSHNNIGDEGCAYVAKILEGNYPITTLALENNAITCAGGTAIGNGLRANTVLRALALSRNALGDEGSKALFAGLHHNRALRSLVLSSNFLSADAFRVVSFALAKNDLPLRSLTISEGQHMTMPSKGDQLAALVGSSLGRNTTLTSLNLPENLITDHGVGDIITGLEGNTTLLHLNLRKNRIGATGAGRVAELLATTQQMQSIDLSSNEIVTGVETSKLAAATLKHHLTPAGLRVGQTNTSLTELLLFNNGPNRSTQMEIDVNLARNKKLQSHAHRRENAQIEETRKRLAERQVERAKVVDETRRIVQRGADSLDKTRALLSHLTLPRTDDSLPVEETPSEVFQSPRDRHNSLLLQRLCPPPQPKIYLHPNDPRRCGVGKAVVLPGREVSSAALWAWIFEEANRVIPLGAWPVRVLYLDCKLAVTTDGIHDVLPPGTPVTIDELPFLKDGVVLVASDGRGDGLTYTRHFFQRGENLPKRRQKKDERASSCAFYWYLFARYYRARKALLSAYGPPPSMSSDGKLSFRSSRG